MELEATILKGGGAIDWYRMLTCESDDEVL